MVTLTGSSGREYETRTYAEELAHRAERRRLIEIAMTEPDPAKAGTAAAKLNALITQGDAVS